jgi:hypothetical protein
VIEALATLLVLCAPRGRHHRGETMTGRLREVLDLRARWQDGRSYARLDPAVTAALRDHAAADGLDATREHYEYILAGHARRWAPWRRRATSR